MVPQFDTRDQESGFAMSTSTQMLGFPDRVKLPNYWDRIFNLIESFVFFGPNQWHPSGGLNNSPISVCRLSMPDIYERVLELMTAKLPDKNYLELLEKILDSMRKGGVEAAEEEIKGMIKSLSAE